MELSSVIGLGKTGRAPDWQLDIAYAEAGSLTLQLGGCWCVTAHLPSVRDVTQALDQHPDVSSVQLDTTKLEEYDSGMVVWLLKVERLCDDRKIPFQLESLPEGVQRLITLSKEVPPRGFVHVGEDPAILGQIGTATVRLWFRAGELLGIVGASLVGLGRFLTGRSIFIWRDILLHIEEAGPDAMMIIALISLLIGVTLAIISAQQLTQFGAEVLIANVSVVGILRQLGPLMTGLVMAGRTGAAYAAEIGSMQVNEEIDALQSLAISRTDFLVMPRVIAMVITVPLLVIYADVIANMGALVFSMTVLDISYLEYITQARKAFSLVDLSIGLGKGLMFGYLISIAGCLRGLQCGRSVSEVGNAATAAVVLAMVLIILSNVLIDILLHTWGI